MHLVVILEDSQEKDCQEKEEISFEARPVPKGTRRFSLGGGETVSKEVSLLPPGFSL